MEKYWLILTQQHEGLKQQNYTIEGVGYADIYLPNKEEGNEYFVYEITMKSAKDKFPELTRNEFARRLLAGERLTTKDWS